MTGRKSTSTGPKASRKKVRASQSSKAGKQDNKKSKAGSAGRSAKAVTSARKTDARPSQRKATPRKATGGVQAAAPLLARSEKKVGPAKAEKISNPEKSSAHASYHPKTEPPATPANVHTAKPVAAFDVLGLAQPWMTLGWRMTAASLAMQARIAKAALNMPLTTTAMRQGAEAWNAWLDLSQRRTTKPREE